MPPFKYDWNAVDWTQPTNVIAAQLGCHQASVSHRRRRLHKPRGFDLRHLGNRTPRPPQPLTAPSHYPQLEHAAHAAVQRLGTATSVDVANHTGMTYADAVGALERLANRKALSAKPANGELTTYTPK